VNKEIETFCDAVRQRSIENRPAILRIGRGRDAASPAMAILRQELDSLVRLIWLLSIRDEGERNRLIHATLSGRKWTSKTSKGRERTITDRDMVEVAQRLHGWTQSVYKFGCAFIHLSEFHNHAVEDPFRRLPESERQDILRHMRNYHAGPLGDDPDIDELADYIPQVFEKIAGNLECYLNTLQGGEELD
jgi:hypothetical protein